MKRITVPAGRTASNYYNRGGGSRLLNDGVRIGIVMLWWPW